MLGDNSNSFVLSVKTEYMVYYKNKQKLLSIEPYNAIYFLASIAVFCMYARILCVQRQRLLFTSFMRKTDGTSRPTIWNILKDESTLLSFNETYNDIRTVESAGSNS